MGSVEWTSISDPDQAGTQDTKNHRTDIEDKILRKTKCVVVFCVTLKARARCISNGYLLRHKDFLSFLKTFIDLWIKWCVFILYGM